MCQKKITSSYIIYSVSILTKPQSIILAPIYIFSFINEIYAQKNNNNTKGFKKSIIQTCSQFVNAKFSQNLLNFNEHKKWHSF